MNSKGFLRISWLLQLLVGVGLFTVSFIIENQVLQAFLVSPMLALLLAAAFELGKAVAIVWHRYMSYRGSTNYPLATRVTSGVFRVGLVSLSLICSMLFLANHLDRPNLEEIKRQDLAAAEAQLKSRFLRLDRQHQQQRADLKDRHDKEFSRAVTPMDDRIAMLEDDLRREMDNVINGVFKGPRYLAIEQRLKEEKLARKQVSEALSSRFFLESERLAKTSREQIEQYKQAAQAEFEIVKREILANSYATDERVNDPHIVAFIQLFKSVFGASIEPLQFVFFFSILLCLLMEIGIVLAFDTVTLSILPALAAQHDVELESEALKAEIAAEKARDDLKHGAAMSRIKKAGNHAIEKAQAYVNRIYKDAA